LLQNGANLRNAARIRFRKTARVSNAPQLGENVRKTLFELQISCSNQLSDGGAVSYEGRFSEFTKNRSEDRAASRITVILSQVTSSLVPTSLFASD
jgi:hypothetical protein